MDYEQLKQKRQDEWREKQHALAMNLQSLRAAILEREDVKQKPDPKSPTSFPNVACPICQETVFLVSKWVTINGIKHKMVCSCVHCTYQGTYDWEFSRWLGL